MNCFSFIQPVFLFSDKISLIWMNDDNDTLCQCRYFLSLDGIHLPFQNLINDTFLKDIPYTYCQSNGIFHNWNTIKKYYYLKFSVFWNMHVEIEIQYDFVMWWSLRNSNKRVSSWVVSSKDTDGSFVPEILILDLQYHCIFKAHFFVFLINLKLHRNLLQMYHNLNLIYGWYSLFSGDRTLKGGC